MQTLIEIDFQGMEPVAALREAVLRHVDGLDRRFGRITACRVVLKAPGGHHCTGGRYEINIRIALPDGKEVDVSRTPDPDERYSDVNFAINDAFKRARRQLQDQVRRMQGKVKPRNRQTTI
jgi:ribosome-associated translation inhibitor RaiA